MVLLHSIIFFLPLGDYTISFTGMEKSWVKKNKVKLKPQKECSC